MSVSLAHRMPKYHFGYYHRRKMPESGRLKPITRYLRRKRCEKLALTRPVLKAPADRAPAPRDHEARLVYRYVGNRRYLSHFKFSKCTVKVHPLSVNIMLLLHSKFNIEVFISDSTGRSKYNRINVIYNLAGFQSLSRYIDDLLIVHGLIIWE